MNGREELDPKLFRVVDMLKRNMLDEEQGELS